MDASRGEVIARARRLRGLAGRTRAEGPELRTMARELLDLAQALRVGLCPAEQAAEEIENQARRIFPQFAKEADLPRYSTFPQASPTHSTEFEEASHPPRVFAIEEKTTPFGAWLRHRRLELHLSIRKLEQLSGVTRKTITGYEKWGHKPSPATASKLCEALEVDLATLLDKLKESEHGDNRGTSNGS